MVTEATLAAVKGIYNSLADAMDSLYDSNVDAERLFSEYLGEKSLE